MSGAAPCSIICMTSYIDLTDLKSNDTYLLYVRIPKVHISSDDDGSKEIELSDDPYDCMRLNVENVPCIVTLCKVSSLSDPQQ